MRRFINIRLCVLAYLLWGGQLSVLLWTPVSHSPSAGASVCGVFSSLFNVPSLSAQTFTEHLTSAPRTGEGTVVLKQDAEIAALVNGKAAPATTASTTSTAATAKSATAAKTDSVSTTDSELNLPTVPLGKRARLRGYRIQVFAGGNTRQGKQEALRMQNLVRAQFPDVAVYTQFISPRWICRVGDFRTYEEASKMLRQLRQTGRFREASIVKSTIIYSY